LSTSAGQWLDALGIVAAASTDQIL
jgi:hypothetical protein